MTQQPQSSAFYQLRLVLTGISPLIWRRLLISSETSMAQLHAYIQICFDWDNEHLHCFRIQGKNYGVAYLGGMSFDDNAHHVRLSRFRLHRRESFRYQYDFTANWQVEFGWKKFCPRGRSAPYQPARAEAERRQEKNTPEPWRIYKSWTATAINFRSKN
jgi:Plasmid pRiA4b ORF-3-like protein